MLRLTYSVLIIEHFVSIDILFNSIGSWYMNLSDYMGGWRLWKFNFMGGWVKISAFFPLQVFFSGIAL